MRKRLLHQAVRLLHGADHMMVVVVVDTAVQVGWVAVAVVRLRLGAFLASRRSEAGHEKSRQQTLTTATTFSTIASFALSMAERDPTNSIGRSTSLPFWGAGETLILHPVSTCIFLIVSPPFVVSN